MTDHLINTPLVTLHSPLPDFIYTDDYILAINGWYTHNAKFTHFEVLVNDQVVASDEFAPCFNPLNQSIGLFQFNCIVSIDNIFDQSSIIVGLNLVRGDSQVSVSLGKIPVRRITAVNPVKSRNRIAVCLATYNPNMGALKAQVQSVLDQTYKEFDIIIQDDHSDELVFEEIKILAESSEQIELFRNEQNIGFYYNFERLLHRVHSSYDYIAFCDQDDIWTTNKLQEQLSILEAQQVGMVYSDLAIYNQEGHCIQDTFWIGRSNHISDDTAFLLNNVATGSTILFRSNLLVHMLPFPQQVIKTYHDHWVAYSTSKQSKIYYIDQALVHYKQHEQNVTGFVRFTRIPFVKRIMGLLSLFLISLKLLLKSDITSMFATISHYQKIFNTNYQRLRLFEHQINGSESNQPKFSLSREAWRYFLLSIRKYKKGVYLNNSDVAIYTALVIQIVLNLRFRIRNK